MVLYLAFLGKVFLEDTIMKYQRNIYFKYNTCTIEEHVHEISTIIMLIYVKFMKCWAKFKTIVNDEDIRGNTGLSVMKKSM